MKQTFSYLLFCWVAAVGMMFTACDRDHDDFPRRGGENNSGGYDNGSQNPGGDSEEEATFSGSWGGTINISYSVLGWTFVADECYVNIIPNKDNDQIGEGELVCFYDDKRCPIVQENIYFTWYTTSEGVVVNVPCDNALNCTVGGLKVTRDKLSCVLNGSSSAIVELTPIEGFSGWNGYYPDTGYKAYFRNPEVKGQWTGVMGTYYDDGTNTYDADYANLRFLPSTDNPFKGTGEEIDFYSQPCPAEWESFYFEWEVVDGMLLLTYPWNEDLNLDLYNVIIVDDQFICQYGSEYNPDVIDLQKLKGYNRWYLYSDDTKYGCGFFETEESSPLRKLPIRSSLKGGRRHSDVQAPVLRRAQQHHAIATGKHKIIF